MSFFPAVEEKREHERHNDAEEDFRQVLHRPGVGGSRRRDDEREDHRRDAVALLGRLRLRGRRRQRDRRKSWPRRRTGRLPFIVRCTAERLLRWRGRQRHRASGLPHIVDARGPTFSVPCPDLQPFEKTQARIAVTINALHRAALRTDGRKHILRARDAGVHGEIEHREIEPDRQCIALHGVPIFRLVDFAHELHRDRVHRARVAVGARDRDGDAVIRLAARIVRIVDVAAFVAQHLGETGGIVCSSHRSAPTSRSIP